MTNIYLNTYPKISDAIHGHSLFENRPIVDFPIRKRFENLLKIFGLELFKFSGRRRRPGRPAYLPAEHARPPAHPRPPTDVRLTSNTTQIVIFWEKKEREIVEGQRQTLDGPFSAVSKPIFAIKYSLESS